MVQDLAQIVAKLITTQGGRPLAGVDAGGQFRPGVLEADEAVMSLNAAFLLALAGDHKAMDHLRDTADDPDLGHVARFLMDGMAGIAAELKAAADSGMPIARDLADCRAALQNQSVPGPKAVEALWKVFFPRRPQRPGRPGRGRGQAAPGPAGQTDQAQPRAHRRSPGAGVVHLEHPAGPAPGRG